jgi:hypothetical protein
MTLIKLEVFERKILRKIFGPCKDDKFEEWRKRNNQEFMTFSDVQTLQNKSQLEE